MLTRGNRLMSPEKVPHTMDHNRRIRNPIIVRNQPLSNQRI